MNLDESIKKIKYGMCIYIQETIDKCDELVIKESSNTSILSITEENIKDLNNIKATIKKLSELKVMLKANENDYIQVIDSTQESKNEKLNCISNDELEYSRELDFNNMNIFNKGD